MATVLGMAVVLLRTPARAFLRMIWSMCSSGTTAPTHRGTAPAPVPGWALQSYASRSARWMATFQPKTLLGEGSRFSLTLPLARTSTDLQRKNSSGLRQDREQPDETNAHGTRRSKQPLGASYSGIE
jgi:hypothetical protein